MQNCHRVNPSFVMMLLQLGMYQPQHHNQQQQQQQASIVMQPAAAGQPVYFNLPSPPSVCETYTSGQSVTAGVILIVAGAFSIIFNVTAIIRGELFAIIGHGIWCGAMVS